MSSCTQQEDEVVEVVEATKKRKTGHRQEDPIWQFFEKIPLDKAKAAQEHRNHDAKCIKCEKLIPGKPEKLKRHVANDCKNASQGDQLYALKQQAKVGASESGSNSTANPIQQPSPGSLTRFIDNVKISQSRMKQQFLLCITFIMTGWSFSTVENPQFVDFMKNVRPNFELPSKHACCASYCCLRIFVTICCCTGETQLRGTLLDSAVTAVKLKQISWMTDALAYHLTLSLDGWSNSRMESVYSWNVIFPSRRVILLKADNLSEISHTGEALSGRVCCTLYVKVKFMPENLMCI